MIWNWQHREWPNFVYNKDVLAELEEKFLKLSGVLQGSLKHISSHEQQKLTVDLMSSEALKTSEIEGDYLNRESLKSSIRRNLGLETDNRRIPPAEAGISEMMVDLYKSFSEPLTHKMLFDWHSMVTNGRRDLQDIGCYRTHLEPMEIVSGREDNLTVHFVAPPSKFMAKEMRAFVDWFNNTAPGKSRKLPALTRASLAHLYFVSIHPFEDGNGRIGRAIIEKALAQSLEAPSLIALSITIEEGKRYYYQALEDNNKGLEVTEWMLYCANTILEALEYSRSYIDFNIEATKLYKNLSDQLNPRQDKILQYLINEGPMTIQRGFTADKYLKITNTSRATSTRDLQDLVKKGALVKEGELKHTRYFLNLPTFIKAFWN